MGVAFNLSISLHRILLLMQGSRRLGPWRSGGSRTPRAAPRRAVLELCQCAPPSTPSPVPTTVAASSPQYSLTFPHHIESRLIINIERSRNVNNRTTLYLCTLKSHWCSQVSEWRDQCGTIDNLHSTHHYCVVFSSTVIITLIVILYIK